MRYFCLIALQLFLCDAYAQYTSGYDSAARKHTITYTEGNFENNKWSDGYIVLLKGDTIYGKVKTGGDFYDIGDRQWQVEFQSGKTDETLYDPTQLRSYSYLEAGRYQAFISLANTLPAIGGLLHTDEPRVFLELVSIGRCSIYTYGLSNKRRTKIRGGGLMKPYCILRTGKDLAEINPLNFRKIMMAYFSDCSALLEKIKDKTYGHKNWREMVAAYNSGCK